MARPPFSDPTPPQRRILDHLLKRESEGGSPPTYREIATAMGWRAPGTVRDHVRALSRKGLLVPSRLARGLRLTDAGREAAGRGDRSANPPREALLSFFGEAGEALEPLAPHFRPRRFPAGTVLWRAGETPSMVVAIETGHIKVYRTLPGGNAAALYLFGPGELFGFLPFLDGRSYPATAETIDDVSALTMSREGLLRGLRENSAVALPLFSFLGRRLRGAFDRIELLSARGALPRVAAALAALLQEGDRGTTTIVSLPVSSGEFARALGITPESFSRAVTDLAEAGVIHRLGRGRFQVLDPRSLRAAASPADL
ncbi:MAG: helix-turn-helix domain-containing protein [bacterium]|nr:helix-turn-helix domain-containing protein [bacterium]